MGIGSLFGRKAKEPQPEQRQPDEPRRVYPAAPSKVPTLRDDPDYARAADALQTVGAKLADLEAKRNELRDHSLSADDLLRLANDGGKMIDAALADSANGEQIAKLDREIKNLERAAKIAGERLEIVRRQAAFRVGQKYSAALAPLRADAISKLTEAHTALMQLFVACDGGEQNGLSGCGPGAPPASASALFGLIANLREFAGGTAVTTDAVSDRVAESIAADEARAGARAA